MFARELVFASRVCQFRNALYFLNPKPTGAEAVGEGLPVVVNSLCERLYTLPLSAALAGVQRSERSTSAKIRRKVNEGELKSVKAAANRVASFEQSVGFSGYV